MILMMFKILMIQMNFAEEWAEEFGDGDYDDGYDDAYDYWEDEAE